MCGRYVVATRTDDVAEEFDAAVSEDAAEVGPSYNIAPTQQVGVVLERTGDAEVRRELHSARWGLVPSWAKDTSRSAKMINARLETAREKPAYRKAFAARRCLLPASGYYEWQKQPIGPKQPYFIHPPEDGLVAMAGLFEWWPDREVPEGDPARWVLTTTILTTEPTAKPAEVHNRMPAMLTLTQAGEWLDRANDNVADLTHMLQESTAAIAGQLDIYPVSRAVGNVSANHSGLLTEMATR